MMNAGVPFMRGVRDEHLEERLRLVEARDAARAIQHEAASHEMGSLRALRGLA